jgi:hypothetical protein
MLKHPDAFGQSDQAERLFKQIKAGVREFEDLELDEVGLLLIYYPFIVPSEERDRA